MDFFSGLGKGLDNMINQVSGKSEEIWESGKANLEIAKQQDAIKRIYRKIGEQVCTEYEQEQAFSNTVQELCNEVQERKRKIEELESKTGCSKTSGKESENPSEYQDGAETIPVKDDQDMDTTEPEAHE